MTNADTTSALDTHTERIAQYARDNGGLTYWEICQMLFVKLKYAQTIARLVVEKYPDEFIKTHNRLTYIPAE